VYYTHVAGKILRKHNVKYHIYADDIQIYLEVDPNIPGDLVCALWKLSKCVAEIQQWMIDNKLKLNQDKTEFFLAASSHHLKNVANISLDLDGVKICPSTSVRNLGVIFDQQMSMSNHITQLCKSVNYLIRNISRIRPYLDFNTCHNTVRALILSRLDYCNVLLNGITQKDLSRLQKLQNKCAKLIYLKPRSEHVSPLLRELHWLPVKERIRFKTLTLVYKSLNGLSPQYISNCLVVRSSSHTMSTRSSGSVNFTIPRTRKCAGDRAFSVAAPQLWFYLPPTIKDATSL